MQMVHIVFSYLHPVLNHLTRQAAEHIYDTALVQEICSTVREDGERVVV